MAHFVGVLMQKLSCLGHGIREGFGSLIGLDMDMQTRHPTLGSLLRHCGCGTGGR